MINILVANAWAAVAIIYGELETSATTKWLKPTTQYLKAKYKNSGTKYGKVFINDFLIESPKKK